MIFKSISLSLTALAMSSTAAFAGSLANQQTEPPVVVAATPIVIAPVAAGGLYGALSFAAIQPDGEFTQDIIDPEYESGEIDLDNGFGVLGAVGYDLGNGFRVEAELGQLKADSDRLVFPDATTPFDVADTDGDITLTTGMINAWYDVGSFEVRPYSRTVGYFTPVHERSITWDNNAEHTRMISRLQRLTGFMSRARRRAVLPRNLGSRALS
jgi:hypothetical protein